MQYLFFCDWLISFSRMSSRYIHVVTCVRISSPFKQNNILLCVCTTFCLSIHPSMGCFHLLTIVSNAAMNMPLPIPISGMTCRHQQVTVFLAPHPNAQGLPETGLSVIYFIPIVVAHLSCCLTTWPFSRTRKILIRAGKGWAGSWEYWSSRCRGCSWVDKVQRLRGTGLSSTFWWVLENPVVAGLPLSGGVHSEKLGCVALGNTMSGHLSF